MSSSLDNSHQNRIDRLLISSLVTTGKGVDRQVEIDFDGHTPVDVTVTVLSREAKWATETMSVIEEQVERMFQSGIFSRLKGSIYSFLVWPAAAAILGIGSIAAFTASKPSLWETMWLNQSDLAALESVLKKTPNLTSDQVTDVVSRQIRNIIRAPQETSLPPQLRDWRALLIIFPIVATLAALVYLGARCYPAAVFAWGDEEDRFQKLVNHRKTIWSILIGSLFVGILANLFVFGISSLARP